MSALFDQKSVIVVGGAQGIGAATARDFAAEGAFVCVVDSDAVALEATVKEIVTSGGRAIAVAGDIRLERTAVDAVAQTVSAFGGIDVLFNSAGVIRYGQVPDLSEDDWDLVVDTNLKGTFLMAKHVIPAMRLRGGGAIVNTASAQAFATQQQVSAYSASKGAVVALTMTMALDHAKDRIRVNCIAPGSVRTPMLRQGVEAFFPEDPEVGLRMWGEAHPIGFLTEPEDVAHLVLFLAGDKARTITGACYRIDGGLLARSAIDGIQPA